MQDAKPESEPVLDLETDEKFTRQNIRAQRVVWVFMTLFLLAGFIGFFGRGGISATSKQTPDGLFTVEYEHFLRYKASTETKFYLAKDVPGDTLVFTISDGFIHNVEIEAIVPEPASTRMTGKGEQFVFRQSPGKYIRTVIFHFKPEHVGSLNTSITTPGVPSLSFSQFVYP